MMKSAFGRIVKVSPVAGRVTGRAVVVASALAASPAQAEILDGLARTIDAAGRTWGPALLVLSALIVGGSIGMGSHQSGEKMRNFLFGGVFLALAAAGGAFILGKFNGLGL
jgi:hypothetical protein